MFILKSLILFYLGASLGSFTNVLVDRGQKGKSLLGRSECDFCRHSLSWKENIPIAGFFLVGGKCRFCKKKLSWQYPIVEASLAVLFVLAGFLTGFASSVASFQQAVAFSFQLFAVFLLFAILVWDLKYMIIPDFLIASGIIVTFIYLFFEYIMGDYSIFDIHQSFVAGIVGGVAIAGFFYALYFFSKGKYIGGGDVKLGFLLGLIVGWQNAYFLLLISYVLGAIVAIFLLLTKKKGMKSQIPFGPFLVVGAFTILFFSEKLLYWWERLAGW